MKQILIVDDNQDLRGIFELAAQDMDLKVIFCDSGEEALTKISEDDSNIDAALVDLAMYPMDGTSLIELIRSNEKVKLKAEMPIAIYTAQVVDDVIRDIQKENNVHKVFFKPSDPFRLLEEVRLWLH